jgi:two-component system response regulator AtoC
MPTVADRLLVLADDSALRQSLAEVLAADGFAVVPAYSATTALARLSALAPDVVLSDVRMPGLDGLELLRMIRERAPNVQVILMTAYDDMPTVVAAMRAGAVDFLVKPLDLHDLRRVLGRVFDDRRTRARHGAGSAAERDERPAPESLGDLVGRDPRMIEIYKIIGQVAATRANVLIRGESGTGKELIAHAIHLHSADASEPFVPVNCTALPATLLESELFGHVRGSFTGAQGDRRGRFALAGRGSIFLDEIGDTSPDFQTKLLRVLQERQFYPVGADRPERTDARVIAATHRDLEAMVASGEFRGDLYYRLRVVEIRVPPLRDRPLDLPLLAQTLVRRASAALGRTVPVLAPDAISALGRHDWPGNVRELENCLTRAMVVASGNVIRAEDLMFGETRLGAAVGKFETLDEMEREYVERVLAASGGQKAQAARILGISRPRLDRLLKKHRLG